MATFEIEIEGEKIRELLRGNRGMAVLLEPILNQILQVEMTTLLSTTSEGSRSPFINGLDAVSRKEAQKKRKATSPKKSSNPSARSQEAFLEE